MFFLFIEKITILEKYSDFSNIFLKKKTLELQEQTELNKHIIKFKKDKELFYELIYALDLLS